MIGTILDTDSFRQQQDILFQMGKSAAAHEVAYDLKGMLYHKKGSMGDWIMLRVPNAYVRGVFSALQSTGAQLPIVGDIDKLDAHISVIRPDELEAVGGPERLKNECGKTYSYTLGRLVSVNPDGWPGVDKCWFVIVHSPELQELRRSLGLSSRPKNNEYDFHITVAIRKVGVLARNDRSRD